MNKTQSSIENLINGNLTTAKKEAMRIPFNRLLRSMIEDYGFTFPVAISAGEFLKGCNTFQNYCNVSQSNNN
jgi:hypothetical protein